jgi:hypothetical protein
MKVKAFHRSNSEILTFRAGTFFCATNTMPASYGEIVHAVEIEANNPASDEDVLEAVKELGLESETVDRPYEYLSPGLMDACVTRDDVDNIIALLAARGFDCAHVTDCDCPMSYVIFNRSQVEILKA